MEKIKNLVITNDKPKTSWEVFIQFIKDKIKYNREFWQSIKDWIDSLSKKELNELKKEVESKNLKNSIDVWRVLK